ATKESAATAWACSGCHACSEQCEHANPVASTLFDARALHFHDERAPERVVASARRHGVRVAEAGARARELAAESGVRADAPNALLIGCEYLRHAEPAARAMLRVTIALAGPVRIVPGCCGLPLLHAGDRPGFDAARARLREVLTGAERV